MSFVKAIESKDKPKVETQSNPVSTAVGAPKMEAFLGKGSKVVGTLHFTGPVQIDGQIEGEVHSQERLVVGETAVINGKIIGAEVLIMGTVNGDITASKRLCLQRPAKVVGNLECLTLSIEEGVLFEGKCTMKNAPGASKTTSPVK